MVTQAPVGQQAVSQPTKKVIDWREALTCPASAAVPANTFRPQEAQPAFVPTASVAQPQQLNTGQQGKAPPQPQAPAGEASQLPGGHSPDFTVAESEPGPQPQPANPSLAASPCSQLLDQIRAEEALTQAGQSTDKDIDDILKEVIEVETEKAERARNLACAKTGDQAEAALGVIIRDEN